MTRLDGYTVEDAKELIVSSIASERIKPSGSILLDTAPAHGLGDLEKQPKSIVESIGVGKAQLGELNDNEFDADMVVAANLLEK